MLIFGNRWLCLVNITFEKIGFCEYKTYLNVQKDILEISSRNCGSYITPNAIVFRSSAISWFYHDFIMIIWMMFDTLLLLVTCCIVALIITDSQKSKWKIMKTEEIEKKKERETLYFNFKSRNRIFL